MKNCATVECSTIFWHWEKIKYNRIMNNDKTNCQACGRPFQYGRPVCGCAQPTGTAEYCPGRHGDIVPGTNDCVENATIAQVTVDTIDGITNLASCFVYVTSLNTTFYIDDKHRILTAWKGIVEDLEYDINANPRNLRSQLLYTNSTDQSGQVIEVVVYYDKEGTPHVLNDEGQAAVDYERLKKMIDDEAAERETQDNLIRSSVQGKQNRLSSGQGIDITSDVVSNTGVLDIIPGSNIQVSSNDGFYTVSATNTQYSAGTGIRIDANNVISLDQTLRDSWGVAETGTVALGAPLAANATVAINIDVSALDFDDATKYAILLQPEYEAGAYWDRIDLSWSQADSDGQTGIVYVHNNDTGSIPATTTFRYTIVGEGYGGGGGSSVTLYSSTGQNTDGAMTQKATTDELTTLNQNLTNVQTNLQGQLDNKANQADLINKQDRLTAGANITISGNTISATNTQYSAGTGISIVGNVISATSQATGLKLQTGTTDIGEGVLLAEDTIYGVYE